MEEAASAIFEEVLAGEVALGGDADFRDEPPQIGDPVLPVLKIFMFVRFEEPWEERGVGIDGGKERIGRPVVFEKEGGAEVVGEVGARDAIPSKKMIRK